MVDESGLLPTGIDGGSEAGSDLEGGLIQPGYLALISEAATIAAGDDPRRQKQLHGIVESLTLHIIVIQDLPQEARAALGGSAQALDRFTTALAFMSGRGDSVDRLPSEADSRLDPLRDRDTGLRRDGLVSMDDFGLVGLAAAYASVARPDAAGVIERGLARTLDSLMPLDLLWALTPAVLDGDRRSTRLMSAVLDLVSMHLRPVGPQDPELPPLPKLLEFIPFNRREWLDRTRRLLDSYDQIRHLTPIVSPYTILSIAPTQRCPGQTVTITGSGFGSQPQKVLFPTIGGTAEAQVNTWSDTGIEVVVPADAICGDVRVIIPAGTAPAGGGPNIDVYKPASGSPHFDGGITHISRFAGNSASTQLRVDPKATINFAWNACPSTAAVDLTVTEQISGYVVARHTGLPPNGGLAFVVPSYGLKRTLNCVLEVDGPCPPSPVTQKLEVLVLPKPNVKIDGMEVTQGIQRFWRQNITENSVSTVAGKDTIVRVYVTADMGGFQNNEVSGIIGVLSVGATDLYPINGITPATPTGGSSFHVARHRTDIDRNNIDHSLNFRIPAAWCAGTKDLFCYLIVPGPGGTVDQTLGKNLSWTWDAETPLKVRWVRIRDERDPATITPTTPTDAQALETAQRALDLLPFPADLAPAPLPTHTTTRDFTVDLEDAALRMDIDGLRAMVENLAPFGVFSFDPEERWLGLTVPWFRGWGQPKTCVAPIYTAGSPHKERLRAAHELGHTLGLCHMHDKACFEGAGSTAEPTLDDVCIDPHWNRTIPANGHDFMSYTEPTDNWITSVNWETLRGVL